MNVARWSLRILPLVLLASVGCSDSEDSTPTPDAATDAGTVDATDAGADTTPE